MSSTNVTDLTLDTNILFYAFDPKDARKHAIARTVLLACYAEKASLSLQCLSEFYRAATRKQLVHPLQASAIVDHLRRGMSIVEPSENDLVYAMRLHQQHGFQFFDCLLLATIIRAGCTTLFSEDFEHNRTVSSLTIINPFKLTQDEVNALLT